MTVGSLRPEGAGEILQFEVPEYHPPARVERGLAPLPKGAVWIEDLPEDVQDELEYSGYRETWRRPAPEDFYKTFKRFENKFGKEAAFQWGIKIPDSWLWNRIMRDVWAAPRMMEQFYDSSPLLDLSRIEQKQGYEIKMATIPISISKEITGD